MNMTEAIYHTDFPRLNFLKRGKVRDLYDLGEHLLIVGNRLGHDDIECGELISSNDQQMLAEIVKIADFSPLQEFEVGKICLVNGLCCIHINSKVKMQNSKSLRRRRLLSN